MVLVCSICGGGGGLVLVMCGQAPGVAQLQTNALVVVCNV